MIHLYTAATPNGHKASITLEELGLAYQVHPVNLSAGEQFAADYLKLNPNGKIPTIVDDDNEGFAVFESGAIMIYLAEKTGRLMPSDAKGRSRVIQWLMFQMGGLGPMMGQANVFHRYFPEKIPAAVDRYQNECRRLFAVLDRQLADQEWLAGEYSIADIANFAWARTYKWSGVDVAGLDNLARWRKAMVARPAVRRGCEIPQVPQVQSEQDESEFVKNAQKIVSR